MNDEQIRELFSAALEGELRGEQRASFERYLAGHPSLAAEFEAFGLMVSHAGKLREQVAVPDLMVGVQNKLRRKRRRESVYLRGRGMFTPLTLGLTVAALAALLWLAFTVLTGLSSDAALEAPASDDPGAPRSGHGK